MSWMNSLRRYVRLPRTGERIARDVDEELGFHLEMRTRELRDAGMSDERARREAGRKFGDLDEARRYLSDLDRAGEKERRRGTLLHEMRQDATLALRQMRRAPGFAGAAVATLALGIGVNTAVFSVVDAYLFRAFPFPASDRVGSVIAGPSREPFPNAPRLSDVDWRPVERLVEATVAWDLDGFTLLGGVYPEYADGAWVSPGYFDVLGVRAAVGRTFTAEDYASRAHVAVISHALWMRQFGGDAGIIGRALRMHSTDRPGEEHLVTVVGILTSDAWHLSRFTDILRPLTTPRMPSLVRVRPGGSLAEVERHLDAVVKAQLPAVDPRWRMTLVSVRDEYVHEARPTLLALAAAGVLLLLLACTSVAGLLAARGAARRRELSVRAALGAGRARLLRQLAVEAAVLAAVAGAAGVAVAHLAVGAMGRLVERYLGVGVPGGEAALRVDARVVAAAIAACAIVALLIGFRHALTGSRTDLLGALRLAGGMGDGADRRGRMRLLSVQIAIAFGLLAGAGLMLRSAASMTALSLGFEPAGVLKAHLLLPVARYENADSRRRVMGHVLDRISADPAVAGVSTVFPHPFRGGPSVGVAGDASRATARDQLPQARRQTIGASYFDVMRVPLLAGRTFQETDADGPPVAIVGEGLARRLWPGGNPVGRRLRIDDSREWRTVVGVARDVRKSITRADDLDVYVPFDQAPRAYVALVVRGRSDAAALAAPLRRALASVDPMLAPSDVAPLAESVAAETMRPRALAGFLSGVSAFALMLAALGLAAAVANAIVQRRRELAVRMAVGATGSDIMRLLLRECGRVALVGIVIGAGIAAGLARVLASQLYGVTMADPLTYAAVAATLVSTMVVAALVPGIRAARIDPARALREG